MYLLPFPVMYLLPFPVVSLLTSSSSISSVFSGSSFFAPLHSHFTHFTSPFYSAFLFCSVSCMCTFFPFILLFYGLCSFPLNSLTFRSPFFSPNFLIFTPTLSTPFSYFFLNTILFIPPSYPYLLTYFLTSDLYISLCISCFLPIFLPPTLYIYLF